MNRALVACALLSMLLASALITVAVLPVAARAAAPTAPQLVELNSRISRASGVRVMTAAGLFEGRGAWVDSTGLHLSDTKRKSDATTQAGPEIMPWGEVAEVRIRRSHAREGAYIVGSLGALVYGAAGAFGSGFAENASGGTTALWTAAGLVAGGVIGGTIGGLLGWGFHGWKTVWKDGTYYK